MIRPIMLDPLFLAKKSRPATETDLPLIQDLKDTLAAHQHECVGMAANMIGSAVCIIIFDDRGAQSVMVNPRIVEKGGEYEAEEGCLSLPGKRKAIRYQKIKVAYENEKLQPKQRTFTGWTAQIIQHEIDHCEGILI